MEGDCIQGPDQGTGLAVASKMAVEMFELGSPLSVLFEIVHRDTVVGNAHGVRWLGPASCRSAWPPVLLRLDYIASN